MTIDVILPCLNEAAALPWLLDRMPDGYRPVVVDNGSTDHTVSVARDRGATVLEVPVRGYGAACHAGLLAATTPVVCVMDADATLDPRELPRLVQPLLDGQADLVVGRRRPISIRAMPLQARLGNAALARALRRRGVMNVRDIGPMRAARREPLLALDIRDLRFGYPLELIIRAAAAGLVITERDVTYYPRVGRSKVTGTIRGTVRTMSDMARVLSA